MSSRNRLTKVPKQRLFEGIMHEYAVTKSIVDIVVDAAAKAGASRVSAINLVIGDLSSIIDDSVALYFDLIAAGTVAAGAKLNFRRVKPEFYCRNCGKNFSKPAHGFNCPVCAALGSPTTIGKEFYVESMEVE
jgi:hydrogenase nickel incorporation protein HypA/HybF